MLHSHSLTLPPSSLDREDKSLSQWCQNPGLFEGVRCHGVALLGELVKSFANLHHTHHQALLELQEEQDKRFRSLLKVQTEDRQFLKCVLAQGFLGPSPTSPVAEDGSGGKPRGVH